MDLDLEKVLEKILGVFRLRLFSKSKTWTWKKSWSKSKTFAFCLCLWCISLFYAILVWLYLPPISLSSSLSQSSCVPCPSPNCYLSPQKRKSNRLCRHAAQDRLRRPATTDLLGAAKKLQRHALCTYFSTACTFYFLLTAVLSHSIRPPKIENGMVSMPMVTLYQT